MRSNCRRTDRPRIRSADKRAVSADSIVLHTQLGVLGTGSALPGAAMTTSELVRRASGYLPPSSPALALRIGKRLGINTRHLVRSFDAPQEVPRTIDTAPKLAARAVRAALADGAYDVQRLRMLLSPPATPHTPLPGNPASLTIDLAFHLPPLYLPHASP